MREAPVQSFTAGSPIWTDQFIYMHCVQPRRTFRIKFYLIDHLPVQWAINLWMFREMCGTIGWNEDKTQSPDTSPSPSKSISTPIPTSPTKLQR